MRYYLLLLLLLSACSGPSRAEQCEAFQNMVNRTPIFKSGQLMTSQSVEEYIEKTQQYLIQLQSIQFSDRVLQDLQDQRIEYYTKDIRLLKEVAVATRAKEQDWSPSNQENLMTKISQLNEATQEALYPTEQRDLKYRQRCR